MTIAQGLLQEFDKEVAATRKVLGRLPTEHFGFKAHAKSMAAGAIASHVTTMLHWGAVTLDEREFDMAPGGVPVEQEEYKNTAELLAAHDRYAAEFRSAIERAKDADFEVTWTLKRNGTVLLAAPRLALLRSMILNHIVHHRAQLCVYLRLLNLPVPSVYGPSADES